ncbi:unnamed protein product [Mycetohabitans rhizoxinica HKI 454]|uniref:Uncharacterized protein n=2 Tax=Mycetohabitans rhizoxinica TaxID=412963 RepID=E5AP27_MYCRK|nr:unnamed protein product [Mycetohabitans rhizoxinica HKI 454]
MRSTQTLIGATCLFLILCLTACMRTAPASYRGLPAASLFADCPELTPPTCRTLGGMVQSILDYQTALDRCNDDKAALRAWAEREMEN